MVSSDGYMACKDGDIDWIIELDNPLRTDYGLKDFFDGISTVLITQSHFQMLLGYDLCFSIMSKPCIMVTESGIRRGENYKVEYIEAPVDDFTGVIERLRIIKHENEGEIWLAGDHNLIWAFLEFDMIDEIVMTMLPVKLGRGVKPFPDTFCERKWHTWNKKYYDNGVIQVVFRSTDKRTS